MMVVSVVFIPCVNYYSLSLSRVDYIINLSVVGRYLNYYCLVTQILVSTPSCYFYTVHKLGSGLKWFTLSPNSPNFRLRFLLKATKINGIYLTFIIFLLLKVSNLHSEHCLWCHSMKYVILNIYLSNRLFFLINNRLNR